jgi:small subunit ribosomal protein S9
MADEEKQPPADDEQPAAEGGEAPAEETPPPAPEAQADQEAGKGDAPVEEPAAEEPAEAPAADEPAPVEATAAPDEPGAEAAEEAPAEPAPEEAPPAEAAAEEAPAAEAAAEEAPPAEAAAEEEEQRRQRPPRKEEQAADEPAVVPGAHLEPDLVLEEARQAAEGEFDPYATGDDAVPVAEGEEAATVEDAPPTPSPAARTPLELAADARYRATGKRKRAIARVILKPGEGTYTINGKGLDTYFPRATLQRHARQPLETTGNQARMDVVAKIHGGGVSSQATALRHGIARALVEADPALRVELKRKGFLTRDPRVKERKKAGLKKARKCPQFSKR